MSNLKNPLLAEDNKKLFEIWEDGQKNLKPMSVRQLAVMFHRNQPRILKELRLWRGFQRFEEKHPGVTIDMSSMEEVQQEYGGNT